MARSADFVYGNPTPPLGDLPSVPNGPSVTPSHPSTPPGFDGPGQTSTSVPPSPSAAGEGGTLPVTGYDAWMLLPLIVVALIVALMCAIRAKSNRGEDW